MKLRTALRIILAECAEKAIKGELTEDEEEAYNTVLDFYLETFGKEKNEIKL